MYSVTNLETGQTSIMEYIIQIHVAMNFIHYECSFHARIFFLLFSLQAEIVQADPLSWNENSAQTH